MNEVSWNIFKSGCKNRIHWYKELIPKVGKTVSSQVNPRNAHAGLCQATVPQIAPRLVLRAHYALLLW